MIQPVGGSHPYRLSGNEAISNALNKMIALLKDLKANPSRMQDPNFKEILLRAAKNTHNSKLHQFAISLETSSKDLDTALTAANTALATLNTAHVDNPELKRDLTTVQNILKEIQSNPTSTALYKELSNYVRGEASGNPGKLIQCLDTMPNKGAGTAIGAEVMQLIDDCGNLFKNNDPSSGAPGELRSYQIDETIGDAMAALKDLN